MGVKKPALGRRMGNKKPAEAGFGGELFFLKSTW
jgi:hypothetical protein